METKVSKKVQKQIVAEQLLDNPLVARRKIMDRHLYEFVKYFWSEYSNDEFKDNWHIQYLCNELQVIAERVAENKPKAYDLIINIPPGMTKSAICSIMYPAWCWTRWFWMRFITGSYSADLSLESAEYSRDILRSNKFKMIYPELSIREDKDTKSNFKIVKTIGGKAGYQQRVENGGNRYSTSVGGTLTGFHAHIQIIDDPLNPKQAASDIELMKANHWCDQTLSTRKTDKKITPLIMIMQRLHQNDPTGHLLEKKKTKIKHICFPGEIRNYKEMLSPQEAIKFYKDDLLDQERLGWSELLEMEQDLGQYGYAGQVGQKPTPPGGGMFQVDHFQSMAQIPTDVMIKKIIRFWDKAGTVGAGKRTAGVKIASLSNKSWIILDVKKGQWGAEQREKIIEQTAVADGQRVEQWIEQEPGSGGKESAESTIRNLINSGMRCYAERPTGSKEERADPYSVAVNNGLVGLLVGEWNRDFIEEHRFFPFGNFKDQVDAAAGAFNKLFVRREARRVT